MTNERKQNFATMMGGTELMVTLRDGSSLPVFIRQLPIEDYPKLLSLIDDELGQVELYCRCRGPEGKEWMPYSAGWAKKLSLESHDQVMESAEALNRDFFERWLRRRMGKLEAIRPGMVDELVRSVRLPGKGLTSGVTSPVSPPNAA